MKHFIYFLMLALTTQLLAIEKQTNSFKYIQPVSVEVQEAPVDTTLFDKDSDGVPNNLDKCSDTPLNVKVDISGCKLLIDDDKDGVSNRDDRCPNTKENVTVNTDGCEPDADKDGVIDMKDECPDTSTDFIVDNVGCPQTAVLKIEFASAQSTILSNSFAQIEEFANFLHNNIGYQVIIYGYTDNINKTGNNKQLSRDRANAVMNLLIKHGIKLTRLTALGMGSKNPIADNNTSEGRAKNRRIEVELLQ